MGATSWVRITFPNVITAGRLLNEFFARGLVNHADTYLITAEEALLTDEAVRSYRQAVRRTWPIGIRTRGAVSAKNNARKSAERVIRPMVQRIRVDLRIDAESKIAIGLKTAKKRRRRIAPSESVSMLSSLRRAPA